MMISGDDKVILTNKLFPPQFSFDGDLRKLKFDLRDERDNSIIEYTLNGETIRAVPFKQMDYTLPKNDTLYSISYTLFPTKGKYKGCSGSFPIYQNNLRCKDFKYGTQYGDDDKDSSSIYAYTGTSNTVWIPEKHNMIDTTYARLTEFPYVISTNYLYITTPSKMDSFWIKGDMIRTFTINSFNFQPINAQFKDLGNLQSIAKYNDWINIPQECFMNCISFNPANDFFFENTTDIQLNGLYNTPSLKTLYFNGLYTSDYGQPKAVFTRQSTIDGKTEVDLYDNPVSNTNSGFVNVIRESWEENPANENAYIRLIGWNGTTSQELKYVDGHPVEGLSAIFECNNPNVIGYRLRRNYKTSGDDPVKMVHIPQQKHNYIGDNNTVYQADYSYKESGKKYFVLNRDALGGVYFGSGDNPTPLNGDDTVVISPFDKYGYCGVEVTCRLDGKKVPTFQHRIAFWTIQDNSTLTLNGETFETNVPKYRLYVYLDRFNVDNMLIRISDTTGSGISGSAYLDLYNKKIEQYQPTSNPNIWYVDLADWMDIDRIQSTTPTSGGVWPYQNQGGLDLDRDMKLEVLVCDSNGSPVVVSGSPTEVQYMPESDTRNLISKGKLSFTY